VASTRGMFAMARDRRLPAPLATVSSRFGTPAGAIVLLIVMQGLLIVASEWTEIFALEGFPHYFALFAWCSTFGGFALLVVYLLMSIGALATIGRQTNSAGVVVAAILGIAITAAAIWGSFYKVPTPTVWAPRYALIWFVVGLIYMVVVKGREPASQVLGDLHERGGTTG
jgi:amino acid transporter